jgi:hypothetical protein
MIFWRGPGPEVRHAEFEWVGRDGSSVLALNMVYGYSNAANLKEDAPVRERRLNREIEKVMRLSRLRLALLMNGSDHIAPDGRVAGWIKAYRRSIRRLKSPTARSGRTWTRPSAAGRIRRLSGCPESCVRATAPTSWAIRSPRACPSSRRSGAWKGCWSGSSSPCSRSSRWRADALSQGKAAPSVEAGA